MSNPSIVLCPGQGAQAIGMGQAWRTAAPAAAAVFERADALLGDSLGAPLSAICAAGPAETLNRTDVSQPAIFVASIASWRGELERRSLAPSDVPLAGCAGLSLGEYTALCIAGAIEFDDALRLVTLRGRAMQAAAEAVSSGMVALIGADPAQAEQFCSAARGADVLVCANFNAPGQVVISGSRAACERALQAASDAGLRATPLPVAGAFHSPLMQPAADKLAAALESVAIAPPRAPVMSNVTGAPHTPDASTIRRRLVEQLTSPVRWEENCRAMIADWKGDFVELAPGKTLAGLMRRIDRAAKVASFDAPQE